MLCVCTSGPLHQFSSPSSPSPRMHCWDISSQLPRLNCHLFGSVLSVFFCSFCLDLSVPGCLCLPACLPVCLPVCLSVSACLSFCLVGSVLLSHPDTTAMVDYRHAKTISFPVLLSVCACLSFCLVGSVLLSPPDITAMVDSRHTKTVSFPVLLSVCTCLPFFLFLPLSGSVLLSIWLCPLSVPACLFICLALSLSICACLSFHLSGSVLVCIFICLVLSLSACASLAFHLLGTVLLFVRLFVLALSFCLSVHSPGDLCQSI